MPKKQVILEKYGDEIKRLYVEEGLTGKEIKDKLGISDVMALKVLRKMGVKIRGRRVLTDADKSEIKRLAEENPTWSRKDIGDELGWAKYTVYRVLTGKA